MTTTAEQDVRRLAFASACAEGRPLPEALTRAQEAVAMLARVAKTYDPDQPRKPKGDPEGGQWAPQGEGGAADSVVENLASIQYYKAPWHPDAPPEDDPVYNREYWTKDNLDLSRRAIERYNKENPDAPLLVTEAEGAHVRMYSASTFWDLNKGLRGEADLPRDLTAHSKILTAVLDKLPVVSGRVVRGADLSSSLLAKYKASVGKTIEERGFLSTTTDGRQRFEGNTKFTITSVTGRDISMLSNEPRQREVLFKPGVRFKVVRVEKITGRYANHVILQEVAP